MKTKLCIVIFLLAAATLPAQTNNLTALLQQGLFEEQANRNLDAAIADYQTLALQFDKDRQLAATAMFRLGECYRAQGRTNEAAAQYQRILRDFSDQQTLATLSRQDLAGMGFSSPELTTAGADASSYRVTAETSFLATQLSGIEKLTNFEDKARAVLAIFPDDTLKNMLLNLPKLQAQAARLKANPQMTYAELNGTTGYCIAIGPGAEPLAQLRREMHSTNLLADVQGELAQQNQWIKERMDFILATQNARLKALEIANGEAVNSGARHEPAPVVTSAEDQEIQRIQQMIQNSPDLINVSDFSFGTPLVHAAYSGQFKVAAYLLDHGADINTPASDVRQSKDLMDAGQVTPLVAAVLSGDKAMTKFLIDHGADINFKDRRGDTPLHLAARKGFQAVTGVLLAGHAGVNFTDQNGDTPLHLAARNGFQAVAEGLLDSHADVNVQNNDGAAPLFDAVESGRIKIIQMLLAAGANVNLKNTKGQTVLNCAIRASPEIVQTLLDAKTDPNTQDSNGRTPLSYAAERGDPQMVKLLLAAKADPNLGSLDAPLLCAIHSEDTVSAELLLQAGANPNVIGRTTWEVTINGLRYMGGGSTPPVSPSYLAVSMNQLSMVQLLLKYKAVPNDSQTDGEPLLFDALGKTNILEALLDAGGSVDATWRDGSTLLGSAIGNNQVTAVPVLLKHHADPGLSNTDGRSTLFPALAHTNVLEELLDAGANVEARDKAINLNGEQPNWTPLAAAAWQRNAGAVEILLEHGANPNVGDALGDRPLNWATSNWKADLSDQDQESVKLLLDHRADPNVRNHFGDTPLDCVKRRLAHSEDSREKTVLSSIAALLRQHGALDKLPDWDSIAVSRPAAKFSFPLFRKGTNDWNHFTLLETIANFYFSQQTYQVPQGNNTWAGYQLNSMLPFPDLTRVTIRRPSHGSTNETRRVVNLLNSTNGIDVAKDVPLEFGDTVEIPERDHALGESSVGLTGSQQATLADYAKGSVKLIAHGQTVELPISRQGNQATLDTVLNTSEARTLLLASSDLSRVKVTRHDPKSGKTRAWTLDCSPPNSSSSVGTPASPYGSGVVFNSPLSYQWSFGGNNAPLSQDLWLRNGDLIEVPEKP